MALVPPAPDGRTEDRPASNVMPGTSPGASAPGLVKTLEDWSLAIAALLIVSPLMVVIALAIRLDSPGPVFYRQARYGLNGKVFQIIKFRTLYADRCDPPEGAFRQVTYGDPRVTRLGRFLRRTSLDELPQLLNVIRGEMSIVGPRPHAPAMADAFAPKIENYALRNSVKPGITGLAQIEGLRGEVRTIEAMARRVCYDHQYVRTASLPLDLWIILMTPARLFRHEDIL